MPVVGGIPLSCPVLCRLLYPVFPFPPTLVLGMVADTVLVLVWGGATMGMDVGGAPYVVGVRMGTCVGGGMLA